MSCELLDPRLLRQFFILNLKHISEMELNNIFSKMTSHFHPNVMGFCMVPHIISLYLELKQKLLPSP